MSKSHLDIHIVTKSWVWSPNMYVYFFGTARIYYEMVSELKVKLASPSF